MMTCPCEGTFDKTKIMNIVFPNDILLKNNFEKLKNQVSKTCMICEAIRDNSGLKFSNIRIIPEQDDFKKVNSFHIMCKNCINARASTIKKKQEKPDTNGNYTLLCKICNANHKMAKSMYNATFKDDEACKCIIF